MTCGKPATKSRNASITWSRFLVVLKSLLDLPSLFLIPSIRKPNVAVDEIVSLQTMYLKTKTDWMYNIMHTSSLCGEVSPPPPPNKIEISIKSLRFKSWCLVLITKHNSFVVFRKNYTFCTSGHRVPTFRRMPWDFWLRINTLRILYNLLF